MAGTGTDTLSSSKSTGSVSVRTLWVSTDPVSSDIIRHRRSEKDNVSGVSTGASGAARTLHRLIDLEIPLPVDGRSSRTLCGPGKEYVVR